MMPRPLAILAAVVLGGFAASPLEGQLSAAATPAALYARGTPAADPPAPRPSRRTVEVRSAAASGVVAVHIPLPAAGETRWYVRTAGGVRVLGPAAGTLALRDLLDGAGLDLTFALPRSHPAGPASLGQIHLLVGGAEEIVEVVTLVPARRALEVALVVADTVRPGEVVQGRLRVRNAGTAADTVSLRLEVDRGWRVEGVPAVLVLERAGEREVGFQIRVPLDAPPGVEAGLRLTARGSGSGAFAGSRLTAVASPGARPDRLRLPMTLFVGATSHDAGDPGAIRPGFGLSAAGSIGGERRVEVLVQDEVGSGVAAAPGTRSNTLLRARVQTRNWSATLGDAGSSAGLLPRFHAAGRGGEASWSDDRFDARAALLLARVGWGAEASEQVATAGAGVRTGLGRFGFALLQAERDPRAGGLVGTGRSAALQYQLFSGSHALQAEAGWLESRTSGAGAQGGAAAEVGYRYTGAAASLAAGLRRAPETALLGGGVHSEETLTGSLAIGRDVALQGSLYSYRTSAGEFAFFNQLGQERLVVEPGATGGSAGLFWSGQRAAGGVSAQAARRVFQGGGDLRRTVTAQLGRGFGPFGVHGSVEMGERLPEEGEAEDIRRFRGTLSWAGGAGSVWASVEQSTEGQPLAAAMNGSLSLGRATMTAMVNTFRDTLALPATSFSGSVAVAVARNTAVQAGAEYRPWAAHQTSPWAASLGVRRTLGLPLPASQPTAVSGLLFLDANGNGRRDEGEVGIAGVPVQLGSASVTTDAAGRFAFFETRRGDVVVLQRFLPDGVMLRPGFSTAGGAYLEIPAVRTGSLVLTTVLADSTGAAGTLAGVRIRLEDRDGRERRGVTDESGIATFPALLAGPVTVTATTPGARPGDPDTVTVLQLDVTPGEPTARTLEVTRRARPVRFLQ
jgi:hypothetical protein